MLSYSSSDEEAIASLVGNRPFNLLLAQLEQGIYSILGAMKNTKNDDELLKLARLWQVWIEQFNELKTRPQSIRESIEQAILDAQGSGQDYRTTDPKAVPFTESRAAMLKAIESIENRDPHKQESQYGLFE